MRLLDLTRSLRRAGRVATGVDRVESAYLKYLLADDVQLFGLARTRYGYLLLDQDGLARFQKVMNEEAQWGQPDLLSRMQFKRSKVARQAEADLRRWAVARAVPWRLKRMLDVHFRDGVSYINVGHSNLTDRVLGTIHALPRSQISAMIHDVIPLEFPQFQRSGVAEAFGKKIARLNSSADMLLYNSEATRKAAEARMTGRLPGSVVAHLGVSLPVPDPVGLPGGRIPDAPYFVTVGTIEPRKNHGFLLDLWEEMGAEAPRLFICGNRGWNNDAVFNRLDALTPSSPVVELNGLDDPSLAALVQGAQGALFPSVTEGFGLPPMEALSLKTRVLCNNLPAIREILGEKCIYADVSDSYLWVSTIKKWAQQSLNQRQTDPFFPPTWEDHFKTVLRLI